MQTYMQLRLVDGSVRHYFASNWGQVESDLRQGAGVFGDGWLATVEGTLVQLSQVVEVKHLELDDAAIQKLHNPE